MTCIATDGKTMAADGLMTERGTIISLREVKIARLPDGRLCGSAGDCAGGDRIIEWLTNGSALDFPKVGEGSSVLTLNLDGTADLFDGESNGQPVRVPTPMAIGSGMDVALGAMDAGASPEQAVRITINRVPTVGGEVTVLQLV